MRQFKDNLLRGLLWFSAFLSVAVLVMIVGFIFYKGFRLISFDFIFGDYSPTGGGGIWPMIVTTVYTIVISLVIATPIGILAAVYLARVCETRTISKNHTFCNRKFNRNSLDYLWIVWGSILCNNLKVRYVDYCCFININDYCFACDHPNNRRSIENSTGFVS